MANSLAWLPVTVHIFARLYLIFYPDGFSPNLIYRANRSDRPDEELAAAAGTVTERGPTIDATVRPRSTSPAPTPDRKGRVLLEWSRPTPARHASAEHGTVRR